MGNLDGKVAFITGAARGQGRSHAVILAAEGADIVALDICRQIETVEYPMATSADLEHTVKLVEDTGRRCLAIEADVRDMEAMRAAVDRTIAELGHIDIVLANAGIAPGVPTGEERAFYDAVDVMLTGVWHTIAATTPPMIEHSRGGAIVITSSAAGLTGMPVDFPGMIGYTAAKHGVVGLMRIYANLLAPHEIRVNSIHPTAVNTPMVDNEQFMNMMLENPEMANRMQNALPVMMIQPEDVTATVMWLVCDSGRYITGSTIPVDAGFCNRV